MALGCGSVTVHPWLLDRGSAHATGDLGTCRRVGAFVSGAVSCGDGLQRVDRAARCASDASDPISAALTTNMTGINSGTSYNQVTASLFFSLEPRGFVVRPKASVTGLAATNGLQYFSDRYKQPLPSGPSPATTTKCRCRSSRDRRRKSPSARRPGTRLGTAHRSARPASCTASRARVNLRSRSR